MDFEREAAVQISTFNGLVPFLEDELSSLGFETLSHTSTSVEINTSLRQCMLLNLQLRTALNILYLLKKFRCKNPEQLYRIVETIPWENIIPAGGYFTVVSRIDTPTVDNSMFASLKVKDAIVDRISARTGSRPDTGSERNQTVVNFFWHKDNAWIYLNTSGEKLSDRKYRKNPHRAPLRENLAAGIILATGYDGSMPLVCPMCGSGSLAIEAALIALKKPPAFLRGNFGFRHILGFESEDFEALRKTEMAKAGKRIAAPIIASDIDPNATRAAELNARTAGVDKMIKFKTCDFAESPVPEGKGIVLLNPEYGERLGDETELEATHKRIGDFFKQSCPGYTGFVFTGNLNLGKKVGLKPSRKIPFWNAKIECRLLKYELYAGSRR